MGNFSYVPGKNKVKDIFSQSQQKSVVTEEAVLLEGLGVLERGTALILRTSGGTKYWDTLRESGTDIKNNAVSSPDDRIDGILAYDIDATLDDVKTVVYLTGCFISECVGLGEVDLASVAGNARKNGLYFEGFAPDGGGPEPVFLTLKASGTMSFSWVPADVNSLSIDWGEGFEVIDPSAGTVSKVLSEPTVIRVDIEGDLPQICPDLRQVTEIHDFGSQIVGYGDYNLEYMNNGGVTLWPEYLPPQMTNLTGVFRGADTLTAAPDWDYSGVTVAMAAFDGTGITSFNSPLTSLVDGPFMFYACQSLSGWDLSLPSLVDGEGMFQASGIAYWQGETPVLRVADYMFMGTGAMKDFTNNSPPVDLQSADSMFNASSMENADLSDWYCPSIANKPGFFDTNCHENFAYQANKQPNWGVPYP